MMPRGRGLVPWRKRHGERGRALPQRRQTEASPFLSLHEELEDLFEDFFSDFRYGDWPTARGSRRSTALTPRVDVDECDQEIVVTAELPGMEEKDVDVTLDEGVLTITGEKRDEREERRKNAYLSERSYGRFERSIPLPAGVERERIEARFKKGLLTVTIPLTEEARTQPQRVPVHIES